MQFGWLYISNEERNQVSNALAALEEETALDELGIGRIRDFFSNLFFPGITTVQTRAKYLLILPYLFKDVVEDYAQDSPDEILSWFDSEQDELVETFMDNCPTETGIIGKRNYQAGKPISQKPLNIYWSALKKYGIVCNEQTTSVSSFCQQLCEYNESVYAIKEEKEAYKSKKIRQDGDNDVDAGSTMQCPFIYPAKCWTENWQKGLNMLLSPQESEFLYEQITRSCKGSLLAHILKYFKTHTSKIDRRKKQAFEVVEENILDIYDDVVPKNSSLSELYEFALQFRRFHYCCQLAYAYLLSDSNKETETYETYLTWRDQDWSDIPMKEIIDRVKPDSSTRNYLTATLQFMQEKKWSELEDLVTKRELFLKQDRAKIANKKYEDKFPYMLDFRAHTASTIIQDIVKGFEK